MQRYPPVSRVSPSTGALDRIPHCPSQPAATPQSPDWFLAAPQCRSLSCMLYTCGSMTSVLVRDSCIKAARARAWASFYGPAFFCFAKLAIQSYARSCTLRLAILATLLPAPQHHVLCWYFSRYASLARGVYTTRKHVNKVQTGRRCSGNILRTPARSPHYARPILHTFRAPPCSTFHILFTCGSIAPTRWPSQYRAIGLSAL